MLDFGGGVHNQNLAHILCGSSCNPLQISAKILASNVEIHIVFGKFPEFFVQFLEDLQCELEFGVTSQHGALSRVWIRVDIIFVAVPCKGMPFIRQNKTM